jgi:hypothetical protein
MGGEGTMKKVVIIILSLLVFATVLGGSSRGDNSKLLKPFEGVAIEQVKRIEFINCTITSDKKESGRSKMIDKPQDIEKVLNYLKSIKLSEYNKEIKNPEFIIALIDNNDKAKHYINSISISKKLMYIYQDELRAGVQYVESNVINEIKKLYSEADYLEELLYKK